MGQKSVVLFLGVFLFYSMQNAMCSQSGVFLVPGAEKKDQGQRVHRTLSMKQSSALLFRKRPNQAGLQRGAQLFMNYCLGCHSLKYMRYSRLALDLGLITPKGQIDEVLLKNNLIFTQSNINDPIISSLTRDDGKNWFGVSPPDLSLTARERGEKWLAEYLGGFYPDQSRPFGVNNRVLPNATMPNGLDEIFGMGDGASPEHFQDGSVSSNLEDLVVFLAYVSDPSQVTRYPTGGYVLGYFLVLLLLAYLLNRLHWSARIKR